jgi:hypothetical protein
VPASTLTVKAIEPAAAAPATSASRKGTKPPPSLDAFITSDDIALHRHGIEVQLPNSGPKVKAVRIDYVRNVYYSKRTDLDPESKRKAFARQLQAAIERELVVCGEIDGIPMLWKPSK